MKLRLRAILLALMTAAPTIGAGASWPPEVTVDPRFELLAVVHLLSDEEGSLEGFAAVDIPYVKDMREFFKKHRGHPALTGYAGLRRGGYDAVAVQKLMLELGDPPELRTSRELSSAESQWLESLRDFARSARFGKFFSAHDKDYRRWVASVRREMDGRDYRAMLEEYTGLKAAADYTVILTPLRDKSRGNMNHIDCPTQNGPRRVTSSIGPVEIRDGEPVFEFWTRRWDVWHELGHTLFDDQLAAHAKLVGSTRGLYKPVAEHCYGSWDQCLREHLVQGLAFRLLAWAAEKGKTQEFVWSYADKKHMPYLEAVVKKLGEFEADRTKYKTLRDFYPRWISLFSELAPGVPGGGETAPVAPSNSDCLSESRAERRAPLGPPSPAAPGAVLGAGELKQRGVWRFTQGEVDAAIDDFLAARRLSASDAELELNLSVALLQKGRLAEALESAERAVSLSAESGGKPAVLGADALSTRAEILRRLGRQESAVP